MDIFHSLAAIPATLGPTVLTIGNFDGVHRGHRHVIAEVIARARALNARAAAVTFDPHPARLLHPEGHLKLLTTQDEKLRLLSQAGLDATLVLNFNEALSRMTAREFAQSVLLDRLHAVEVHEGENFRFGHRAEANIDSLGSLGRELGFAVRAYKALQLRGGPISSSRIRSLIAEGDMRRARALLGRVFSVHSTPASGRGYGTRYAVPTINLAPYSELLPANGVYVTCMRIAGKDFDSVTNIGNRPTFGADSFAVESYLLNFHPLELTESTPITLSFFDRLRPEIRWPSPEALKAQIGRDVARAQRYFRLMRATHVPSEVE